MKIDGVPTPDALRFSDVLRRSAPCGQRKTPGVRSVVGRGQNSTKPSVLVTRLMALGGAAEADAVHDRLEVLTIVLTQ